MDRFKVTIFGAGNIGSALAVMLCGSGDFQVTVIDPSEDALDKFNALKLPVDLQLPRHGGGAPEPLGDTDVIVAAVPDLVVPEIARVAATSKTHFLDFAPLRPDVRRALEPLALEKVVLNGCGVAPGIVENIAIDLLSDCSPAGDLTIRVGSLPRLPTNRLGYGQIWDIDGLIDEYTKPCEALRDGEPFMLAPLESVERVILDGVAYECFTTSRGLTDMDLYRQAGGRNLTFKTLRYPGHLDYMRFLLDDLSLRQRRDMLRSLLLNGMPIIEDDVLLLFLTAWSARGARKTERSLSYKFRPDSARRQFNAMTSVASGYAGSLLALLRNGDLGQAGFAAHHKIPSHRLLENAFLKPLLVN
ncbi:saccharopine dehydrogenase NADP-binding domain-containing protein [Pseudomonas sp. R2.Fl]|nr:saccharopine dehydrogenase NADP-binding domain-containing protein [Pseudomonas sp. R2.Fl]